MFSIPLLLTIDHASPGGRGFLSERFPMAKQIANQRCVCVSAKANKTHLQQGGAMAHWVRKLKYSCSLLGVGRRAIVMNVLWTDTSCGTI